MNNFDNKIYSDTILSCSVDYQYDSELGEAVYVFNAGGPVYGPNGEWELDPDNYECGDYTRPVFATCKNNCPGGELCLQLSVLSYFALIKL